MSQKMTPFQLKKLGKGALYVFLACAALIILETLMWQGITASGNPNPTVPHTASGVATLDIGILVFREGLECILVLSAITASMIGNNASHRRPIAVGAGIGFFATIITWFIIVGIVSDLMHNIPALDIQALTGLLAVIVLLIVMNWFFHKVYWTGWISIHNRKKRDLLKKADNVKNSKARIFWGLVLLGFSSFYREGFEVVLFLQSYRIRMGGMIVLGGVILGLVFSSIVAILNFIAHQHLPYKKMLVVTGIMLGAVLLVMVGEQAQEMQLAHWLPITQISWLQRIPPWMGLWFSVFPTVETLLFQMLAALFVIGSYFLARYRMTWKIDEVLTHFYQLLLSWPIRRRLVLGFLMAAVIAAALSSIPGIERANGLQNQAQFYRSLVDSNIQLTKEDGILQLMNTDLNQALAGASSGNQGQTIQNVQGLASSYETLLTSYTQHNLIDENPAQLTLVHEAGRDNLVIKQRALARSALLAWQSYQNAQSSIINDIESNRLSAAQQLNTGLANPTHNDALSALHALIQSEGELANSALAIEGGDEQRQLMITLVGALITLLAVGAVGWFISGTIVPRLKDLRNVVQSVKDGRLNARVCVLEGDEIAQATASVNTMVNTMVGLLEEACSQHDALTERANSLFSDMRAASAGDLRVNAAGSNDPVGMLAHAFNLTVGRFRHLVLRIRTSLQQIDVIFQQEIKRAESSVSVAKGVLSSHGLETPEGRGHHPLPPQTLARLHQVHSLMQIAAHQGTEAARNSVLAQLEQAYHLTEQLETRSMLQVSKIQQTLLKAGQNMHILHTNIANALSLVMTIEGELVTNAQESSLAKRQNLLSSGSTSVSQEELARFYLEFAQERIAATSQLRSIIQEMQVSLATFQVEVPEKASLSGGKFNRKNSMSPGLK